MLINFIEIFCACKLQPGSKLKSESSSISPQKIAIVNGGFSSCDFKSINGSIHQKKIDAILKELREQGNDIKLVISCFDTESVLHYRIDDDPIEKFSLTLEDYWDSVADLLNDKEKNVYIIGHSHGGWLAMKTLQSAEFEHLNVKYLVTVDPISRITCTPMQGLFEYLNKPRFGYCKEFPIDLTPSLVESRTGHWTNYYQHDVEELHSEAAKEADQNIKKSYPEIILPTPAYNAHIAIWEDNSVWEEFKSALSDDF